MTTSTSNIISIGEAARRLDLHVDTLRNWQRRGLVTLIKLPNGRLALSEPELERITRPQEVA